MIPRQHNIYTEPEGTQFYESWCTDHEKNAIEYALNQVEDKDHHYVEIGCFEGRSSVFIANLISPRMLVCIDPFKPHEDLEGELVHYNSRDIESIFRNNIRNGTNGNVSIQRMGWEEYYQIHPEEEISFLYLDGPHTYDNVTKSLEVLVPLIVPGGIMMGDDYDWHEVQEAADDYFGKSLVHPESYRAFLYKKEN